VRTTPEWKNSNRRRKRRWEDDIKMAHINIWFESVDSIYVLQGRDLVTLFLFHLPREFSEPVSITELHG
jgi:hypothetical protein